MRSSGATPDVLVDYTDPVSVKPRTFEALGRGIRAVIGTSGLTADDYVGASKVDSPSGTTRELAETMGEVAQSELAVQIEQTQ